MKYLYGNLRIIAAVFFLTLFSTSVYAGEHSWLTDFEQAKKLSAEKGLPILADFTGSDWCPYCIKLNDEVFSKSEFIEFAKDNFILLRLDFPQKQHLSADLEKQNKKLAEQYDIKEFPAVVILDKDGNFIMKTGYREGGCDSYISFLKIVRKLAAIYSCKESCNNSCQN